MLLFLLATYAVCAASIISDILMVPVQLVIFRKRTQKMSEEELKRYQNIKIGMTAILSLVLIIALLIVNPQINWKPLLFSLIISEIISNILISGIEKALFRNNETSDEKWWHFKSIENKTPKVVFVVVTTVIWIWFYSGWLS